MTARFHYPKCWLNIGQYKTIDSTVCLEVKTRREDEFGNPDPTDPAEDYTDGVRITGELAFDSWPLGWNDHPVKVHATGQLTLREDERYSKLNILFIKMNCSQTIIKDKQKRYFWLFYVIGRPLHDGLELFPEKPVYKVFTCTDFRGLWPIGVSSVVVARDQVAGKKILIDALKQAGVNQPEISDLTLQELDITRPNAVVLNPGSY